MRTSSLPWRLSVAVVTTGLGALLTGCATSKSPSAGTSATSGMNTPLTSSASATSMSGMGMDAAEPMYSGNGLAASDGGFTLAPVVTTTPAAGQPEVMHFRILDSAGMAVTAFEPDQTKMMHFYLVRFDLTGFQHVHPVMASDGTWAANLAAASPGTYRAYVAFNAKNAAGATVSEVLSRTLTMPGPVTAATLPAPASATTVDGYTLTVSGQLMAGMAQALKVSVSKDGKPVTNLQPYLATYAHLTAIHAGDLAFAHLHPEGAAAMTDTGGPDLIVDTTLPRSGDWRFFIQFQAVGALHTAAITLHAS